MKTIAKLCTGRCRAQIQEKWNTSRHPPSVRTALATLYIVVVVELAWSMPLKVKVSIVESISFRIEDCSSGMEKRAVGLIWLLAEVLTGSLVATERKTLSVPEEVSFVIFTTA
jgi:hypothetical protein